MNTHKLYRHKLSYIIYGTSLAVLGVVGISRAHAENVPFSVNVNTDSQSIAVSASAVSLTMDPASAALRTGTVNVTVGSGNESGYRLLVSANGTDLVMQGENPGDDVIPTLPTLEGGYTADAFPANHWGYRVGTSGNFLPFPANTSTTPLELVSDTGKVDSLTTTFTFAAKADYLTVPGEYGLALNFQITPYVTEPTDISEIEHLQDFAGLSDSAKTSILQSMTANTNYPVKDKRDDQDYTIAKLTGTANNGYARVWMTKNLNLAGGTALTSELTDMDANWTMPTTNGFLANNTLPAPVEGAASSDFSSNTMAYVLNSGNTTCGSNTSCYSYYSWTAATLGSGLSLGDSDDGHNAPYSICPKGWKLPTSTTSDANAQENNNWKTGDFYKLATAYGANLESSYMQSTGTFYTNAGPGTSVPSFQRAGLYNSGSFDAGGSFGLYWSSTANSSTYAYYLSFSSGYVNPADRYSRRYGISVRCILQP